ncbi:MAG: hypothetical protein ACRD1R_04935 [Acidobacteriota bacterium]
MTEYQHRYMASGGWFRFSWAEQLANIGSEVERAISWHRKQDQARFEKAFERLLELIDLTLTDPRWKGPKRREIARLREELCVVLLDARPDDRILDSLKKEFLYYGILAALKRNSGNP